MSELKARTARSIADEEEMLELGADCPIESAQVYLKSEADKVIAKLKEIVKSLILDNYLKDKETRHNKYKRCLAMAKWCDAEADVADADGDYEDMQWYQKWHQKWLKLVENFKEAK